MTPTAGVLLVLSFCTVISSINSQWPPNTVGSMMQHNVPQPVEQPNNLGWIQAGPNTRLGASASVNAAGVPDHIRGQSHLGAQISHDFNDRIHGYFNVDRRQNHMPGGFFKSDPAYGFGAGVRFQFKRHVLKQQEEGMKEPELETGH